MYPEGTQIILQEMRGESQMPYGLKGTVKFVDDAGQIHMSWENGSSLALNIDEDTFEKLKPLKRFLSFLLNRTSIQRSLKSRIRLKQCRKP